MPTTPTIRLNDNRLMPQLGYGVWRVSNDEAGTSVGEALKAGYRSIDTASIYDNEEGVGKAIAAADIPRDELFITTKLWVQHAPTGSVEDETRRAFESSLTRLGMDYVDLYLIHQPLGDYYSEWRAMQQLNKEGLARAIGVSNFHSDRLVDLIDHNEIVPAVNQIETHPFHQRHADQQVMREHGVQIESWGPFAEGRNDLFTNPVLAEIGRGHGKSVAHVVLRWLIQRDVVVIPKSVRRERIAENYGVFDFQLTDEQMARISEVETGDSLFFDHRDPATTAQLGGCRLS